MHDLNFFKALFKSEIYRSLREEHASGDIQGVIDDLAETSKSINTRMDDGQRLLFSMHNDLSEHYAREMEFEGFVRGYHLGACGAIELFHMKARRRQRLYSPRRGKRS